ncbi:MAG: helix-turn-helix domain-containing protein [Solirubrobacteraceae bacterium]
MPTHDREPTERGSSRSSWPSNTPAPETRRNAFRCYLLDVDPDLAGEFDLRMRVVARQSSAVTAFEVEAGICDPTAWLARRSSVAGLLLIEGVIAIDMAVGGRSTTELVGAGDLLQLWERDAEELLERDVCWQALSPARLAVLDVAFVERVRGWPQITQALLRRAGKRAQNLDLQRTICSHPRLEVRLALLLWHLAARWGRVERGGIRLTLPLTHRLLGRLVSAERPSVSHALARLENAGLVTGGGGEWHLCGTPEQHLAQLMPSEVELATEPNGGGRDGMAHAVAPNGAARTRARRAARI